MSYVLPIRTSSPADRELDQYLEWLSRFTDVIVVDGSSAEVFETHAARWRDLTLQHVPVDRDLTHLVNGKVSGVLTGIRRARYEMVVIADDDVRYDEDGLRAMVSALGDADVVRPQNYFDPLPWHALVDTARSLLNRMSGGDWPGTIGIRQTILIATRGYDGNVLFENLELIRTVVAAGGIAACPLGLYVRRLPPTSRQFWSQRVRQAYDEFARPHRLALWLAVLPAAIVVAVTQRWWLFAAAAASIVALAEAGRQRRGGTRVFPFAASLAAPVWICERAISAWAAVAARIIWGGIPYRSRVVARAATPVRVLRHKLRGAS